VLLVDGADRGGLSLGDDEHAGRMGARSESGKRPVPRVGWPKLAMERSAERASRRAQEALQAAEAITAAIRPAPTPIGPYFTRAPAAHALRGK
jgi:hypothetical protein